MSKKADDYARALLGRADCLYTADAVSAAIARLTEPLERDIGGANPLILVVMQGGLFFAGQLLQRLSFPLEMNYVDVSRYGSEVAGGKQLRWRRDVPEGVRNRSVLLVDDILDEGITLNAIRDRTLQLGASDVRIAVLAEKCRNRAMPISADFTALTVPDRFVFGSGMDVRGLWRHLPGIYAVSDGDLQG